MPRFAANLNFLFTELPFLDRFEAAAKAGFKAVEIGRSLRRLGRRNRRASRRPTGSPWRCSTSPPAIRRRASAA